MHLCNSQTYIHKSHTHRENVFTRSGVFTDTGMDLTLWYIVHRLVKCWCRRGKCSCAASEDSARDSVLYCLSSVYTQKNRTGGRGGNKYGRYAPSHQTTEGTSSPITPRVVTWEGQDRLSCHHVRNDRELRKRVWQPSPVPSSSLRSGPCACLSSSCDTSMKTNRGYPKVF